MPHAMTLDTRQRYDALDGIRGLAAISVMIYHYTERNGLVWLRGAWIAVDLFFVLSGFVIAHSYADRITKGLPFAAYFAARLIRLWPLYAAGMLLGLLSITVQGGGQPRPAALATAFGLGMAGIPYFNTSSWPFGAASVTGALYPLDHPAWTLFFELFVNVLFFAVVRFTRAPAQLGLVIAAYAVVLMFHRLNPGWGAQNFVFGFPRVIAEFFLGALIYRQRGRLPGRLAAPSAALSAALFVVFGALMLGIMASRHESLAFAGSIVVVPVVIALFSRVQVSGRLRDVCAVLGQISYPLYILQVPIYRLGYKLFAFAHPTPVTLVAICAGCAVAVAWLAVPIDLRVRRWLARTMAPRLARAG